MVKKVFVLLLICFFAFCLSGCKKKIPENWYEETIDFYREGFATDWKNAPANYTICDEQKDKNNKFGYLLKDLDGDGINELFIGIIDDSSETKFTDLIIYHNDFGPHRSFAAGNEYYLYICDGSTIRNDYWYGSETRSQYMKYDSENNSFPEVDGGSKPQKIELTEF